MTRVRSTAALIAVSAALVLSGCAEGSGAGAMAISQPQDLVGRWITGVEYPSPDVPFILIAEDGTWTGSDGCNGAEGEWTLDGTGGLTASMGMRTLIACDGVDLPTLFTDAVSAGVDGGRLRLFDDQGFTTVKLARAAEG